MGLMSSDTPIIRQSERTKIYQEYLEKLLESGNAYYCFMSQEELEQEREEQKKQGLPPRYSGKYRDYPLKKALERIKKGEKAVIRIKVPENKEIVFTDLIRGENKTNTKNLADFVIAKDLKTPLYNFVVVIDDYLMGITYVLRGEDHIPNTPKQIIIHKLLGWNIPQYAHFPLILNQDKTKLSKRKNKVSVNDYLKEGYLKESLLNFLLLLGWNDQTENEIFSLEEMVKSFSLERVHKGGAVFDQKKLDWLNGYYIRKLNLKDLKEKIKPFLKNLEPKIKKLGETYLEKVLLLVQEKLKKLSEIEDNIKFFYEEIPASKDLVCNPKMKVDEDTAKLALEKSIEVFLLIKEENFNSETLKEKLIEKIKELGLKNGQMLWPIRSALTGVPFSPGAFEVAEVLGKQESLNRLEKTLKNF
jgi:glutamyl-tRNA synthetase